MLNQTKRQIWIVESGSVVDQSLLQGWEPFVVYRRGNIADGFDEFFQPAVDISDRVNAGQLEVAIDRMAQDLDQGKNLVYLTALPAEVDAVGLRLMLKFPSQVQTVEGRSGSFVPPDALLEDLEQGWVMLDGTSLKGKYYPTFSPSQTALIYSPISAGTDQEIESMLLQVYPPEHMVYTQTRSSASGVWSKHTINELDLKECTALLVPPRSPDASLESFAGVIGQLRAPNGCPWDRKQTHESLRPYLLEETYEALAAIDAGDMTGLSEELGDLVLQILLHAQIAEEKDEFTLSDVMEGINRKIVFRHPHVFGEVKVRDEKDVLQNWEKLKERERAENGEKEEFGILNGVPKTFPALGQAQAIQDRAARVGFDWDEIEPVKAKVMEEYSEVESAADEAHRAKELGDLLFAVVNLVRWYKVDAETALRETNQKFRDRFSYIERKARETGRELSEMSLDEMDVYWDEAKHLEQ